MTEANDRETMLRRLRIRSWRRGIKEMDLILGAYADHRLAELDDETVALYQQMLLENDQDLYQWVSGQAPAPPLYADLTADIAAHMAEHVRGGVA
ncbi:antitoxin CptB [Palleronia salina]|uniref:FAD assembly factor SdhE n=1 Tax=Palleronia salina TaxID=313368 RepID=A0A1M6G4G7_9RHOB|nr:succinate dehydrogenase assembly factor 2 [Palleronia salina]SHJ04839.1 antitoxin CptB [Palleronia salina]